MYKYLTFIFIFNLFSCDVNTINNKFENIKILNFQDNHGFDNANILTNGEMLLIYKYCKKNNISKKIIFDVGSNNGGWIKYFFEYDNIFDIYLFEPLPNVLEESKLLLSKYNLDNVNFHNIALGNSNEIFKEFYYYLPQPSLSGFFKRDDFERWGLDSAKYKIINVSTTKIDDFCKNNFIKEIDFLKIDTEGYELDVLLGAFDLLKSKKIQIIQFEYGPDVAVYSQRSLKSIYDYLINFGYSIYRISLEGLVPVKEYNKLLEKRFANYLALI
jgi:FkbM family methyltransferase